MLGFLAPFDQLQEIIGFVAFVSAGLLALMLGSTPVRVAGLVQLVDGLGVTVVGALAHGTHSFLSDDLKGVVVWGVYLVMTLKWPGRWLIALAALQGFAVLVRGAFWLDLDLPRAVTSLLLNGTGWLMVFILVAATLIYPARGRSKTPQTSVDEK